jgi:ABC-2 type transport system ATP-binding protein
MIEPDIQVTTVYPAEAAWGASDGAIRTVNLTKRYGKETAVDAFSLTVPYGSIYALLGRNGAGKTTTIQMLLGLVEPTSGEVAILGMNPFTRGVEVKQRVGYVGENQRMYEWMTVAEMLRFVAGFYAVWNGELERHLLTRFQLDPQKTLKQLSRGMKAKVALMLALCHDPDVLILDECTSGLDVVVRREFLETVIDLVQCEGKTTLFSTHLVDEVERIADWVGLMDEGRLVFQMPMERLKDWVKQVRLIYDDVPPAALPVSGILRERRNGREILLTMADFSEEKLNALRGPTLRRMDVMDLHLEDIFVECVRT